jgi:Phytoene/squalene synthetase
VPTSYCKIAARIDQKVSLNPAHMSPVTTAPDQAARRDRPAWQLASLPTTLDPPAAEAFCRRVATAHYENFSVVSRLVPADLRQDFANIYAYARWSDDLADESGGDATAVLTDWRLSRLLLADADICVVASPDVACIAAIEPCDCSTLCRSVCTVCDASVLAMRRRHQSALVLSADCRDTSVAV